MARTESCRCGAQVITGYDARTAALPATIDTYKITAQAEQLCVIVGRATYYWDGAHIERRSRFHAVRPVDGTHPAHICHQPVPAELRYTEPPRTWPTYDEPPF